MQYIWQHRLYRSTDMVTNDGLKVRVIDPGLLNTDAGPDFFNAKVEIDGHLWAGNVELHVRATDWKRHGHDHDKAYDSVILHVVSKDDAPVYQRRAHTAGGARGLAALQPELQRAGQRPRRDTLRRQSGAGAPSHHHRVGRGAGLRAAAQQGGAHRAAAGALPRQLGRRVLCDPVAQPGLWHQQRGL